MVLLVADALRQLRPTSGSLTRLRHHRLSRHCRREPRTAGQGNRLTPPYTILNSRAGNASHETGSTQSAWCAPVGRSLSLAAVVVREGVSGRPNEQNRIGRERDTVRQVGGVE